MIILIPSFNELFSLKKFIVSLKEKKYNFLVIDDNSNDGTYQYLKKKKIFFIRNKKNLGYTKSLLKGFDYLVKSKYQYIFTMDADGEHKIQYLDQFIKKLKKQKLDMIVGNRDRKNRFLEWLIGKIFYKIYKISDPLCGFRVYNKKKLSLILKKINKNYFLTDIITEFDNLGFKYSEIKIKTNTLIGRKSRIGNVFISNLKILNIMRLILKN